MSINSKHRKIISKYGHGKKDFLSIQSFHFPFTFFSFFSFSSSTQKQIQWSVLEYDRRFQFYGERFVYYDYNEPTTLPDSCRHAFDFIVADPPHLSEECFRKVSLFLSFSISFFLFLSYLFSIFNQVAETIRFLSRTDCHVKVMFLTGATMEEPLRRIFNDNNNNNGQLRLSKFEPRHANQLSNRFACFLNYVSRDDTFAQVL
jgi:hypothetical protein